jgi:hypothetical protein
MYHEKISKTKPSHQNPCFPPAYAINAPKGTNTVRSIGKRGRDRIIRDDRHRYSVDRCTNKQINGRKNTIDRRERKTSATIGIDHKNELTNPNTRALKLLLLTLPVIGNQSSILEIGSWFPGNIVVILPFDSVLISTWRTTMS